MLNLTVIVLFKTVSMAIFKISFNNNILIFNYLYKYTNYYNTVQVSNGTYVNFHKWHWMFQKWQTNITLRIIVIVL